MKKLDDGLNSFKHMKQQGSLLSILENRGLLSDGTCFVEFGAGKGTCNCYLAFSNTHRKR